MNQNLCVNKTNFHMKGFALGLALKQRRNATQKSPIVQHKYWVIRQKGKKQASQDSDKLTPFLQNDSLVPQFNLLDCFSKMCCSTIW